MREPRVGGKKEEDELNSLKLILLPILISIFRLILMLIVMLIRHRLIHILLIFILIRLNQIHTHANIHTHNHTHTQNHTMDTQPYHCRPNVRPVPHAAVRTSSCCIRNWSRKNNSSSASSSGSPSSLTPSCHSPFTNSKSRLFISRSTY